MRKEDAEVLKKIVGKKVVAVRYTLEDPDDYGFDIVFEDGTVLELYDIKGRGMAFCIVKEVRR